MYKLTNILKQRNKIILKLKDIDTNESLKLDLTSRYYMIPFKGELLDYSYEGHFQDIYDKTIFAHSLHNERINLNFYNTYK